MSNGSWKWNLRIGTAQGEAEYPFGRIADLTVGPDGRVYVFDQAESEIRVFNHGGRYVALGSDNWDVFSNDGRYLGIVRMPSRFQPLEFADDMVYGVQRDDLDLQYVLRARIAGPG